MFEKADALDKEDGEPVDQHVGPFVLQERQAFKQALPSTEELSQDFGDLLLVSLRIELEREVRRILGSDGERPISLSDGIQRLVGHGLSPNDHARLVPIIALANRAAHGLDNDPAAVASARNQGVPPAAAGL